MKCFVHSFPFSPEHFKKENGLKTYIYWDVIFDIWDLREVGKFWETSKVNKDLFVSCVESIEWGCLDTTHLSTL